MNLKDIKAGIIHILKNYKIDEKTAEKIAFDILLMFEIDSENATQYAEIFIDGGSRGNPGEGASACIIYHNGKKILEGGIYFKKTTNNAAEYNALIFALKESINIRIKQLKVFTDSELLERQIKNIYAVKSPALIPLYKKAIRLSEQFEYFSISHIPREKNLEADRLANLIMDKRKNILIKHNG